MRAMVVPHPAYGCAWPRNLPSSALSPMDRPWRVLFATGGLMVRSGRMTSTIGCSALRPELPRASGQRSTGKKPRRSSMPTKCDQPASPPSNEPSRTDDGRWDAAYASARTSTVPDDLQQALDANPQARAFFATLNSKNRFAILFRIQNVKKAETRARKITEFIQMLSNGEKLHP